MYKLIKYFKPNCTPCKIMEKTISEFLNSHSEVELKNVNINDLSTEEYKALKIRTVPTVHLLEDNNLVSVCAGSAQLSQFTKWFDDSIR